jgi:hypothetical protein
MSLFIVITAVEQHIVEGATACFGRQLTDGHWSHAVQACDINPVAELSAELLTACLHAQVGAIP